MEPNQKQCPYCAEVIKSQAIICRYCQRDLPPISSLQPVAVANDPSASQDSVDGPPNWENITLEQRQLIEQLGVSFDGKKYYFHEYGYDQLTDAVNYAERCQSTSSSGSLQPQVVFNSVRKYTNYSKSVSDTEAPITVKCPHCSEQVQNDATICPHCRHAIFSKNKSENAFLSVFWYVVIFVAMFFMITQFTRYESKRIMQEIQSR